MGPQPPYFDMPFLVAIKIGAGFAVGATLVVVAGWSGMIVLVGLLSQALVR